MKKISDWSINELCYQVVFPRLNIIDYILNEEYRKRIINLVQNGIGGFCVFGGNIENNIRVISELQMHADIPLLFAGDFENGLPMRLTEGTDFPHNMALGRINLDYTSQTAQMIAIEAKAIGVHWNLAPVADINNNPNNPVINIRSFGEDPISVSAHTQSFVQATQQERILACAKHFPGHGNTSVNSHLSLPVLDLSFEELMKTELLPFTSAISAGVKSIMLGHLALPKIDNSGLPASLSKIIVQDLLRNYLKFEGIVLTDALEMAAITDNYSQTQVIHLAIIAGVNVLLMPESPESFVDELISIVQNNEEYQNHLINSVELIIKSKRWCGLLPQYQKLDLPNDLFVRHPYKALKFADLALKIEDEQKIIPIKDEPIVAVFALLQTNKDFDKATKFIKMLGDAVDFDMDFAYINEEILQENIDEYKRLTQDSDLVIFPIFVRARTYGNKVALPSVFKYVMDELSEGKKVIAILFGSPYYSNEINTDAKILAYSDSYASMAAVVARLANRDLKWIDQ